MSNPNKVIVSLLMNNKITSKALQKMPQVATLPTVIKHAEYHGINEEIINGSYYSTNYRGIEQAKILEKEKYNPFKNQHGKD